MKRSAMPKSQAAPQMSPAENFLAQYLKAYPSVTGLVSLKVVVDRKMAAIDAALLGKGSVAGQPSSLSSMTRQGNGGVAEVAGRPGKKSPMSAVARKRIADAQKKRWALFHKNKAAAETAHATPKHRRAKKQQQEVPAETAAPVYATAGAGGSADFGEFVG